jgi:hypothetical protein
MSITATSGSQLRGKLDCLLTITGLSHNLHVLLTVQCLMQRFAHQGMVVGNQDR